MVVLINRSLDMNAARAGCGFACVHRAHVESNYTILRGRGVNRDNRHVTVLTNASHLRFIAIGVVTYW